MSAGKLLAFAAIYVIWGSTYLAIRIGIETLPPLVLAGTRFLLAGLPFYAWLRSRGVPRPSRVEWRSATVIGALLLCGGNGVVTWAEQWVPSGIAALLIAGMPLWMTTLDGFFFRGARPTGWVLAGVLLGIAGVAILVGPTGSEVRTVPVVGGLALVFASLSWAFGSLLSRQVRLPDSPMMAVAMEMIAGGAILLVGATLLGEWRGFDPGAISARSGAAFLYLVTFGSIVALSAYVWLLRHSSAAAVSTYAFVNPIVAVLLGWALAGEQLNPRVGVAATLIIGAVALIHWARIRSAGAVRRAAARRRGTPPSRKTPPKSSTNSSDVRRLDGIRPPG